MPEHKSQALNTQIQECPENSYNKPYKQQHPKRNAEDTKKLQSSYPASSSDAPKQMRLQAGQGAAHR